MLYDLNIVGTGIKAGSHLTAEVRTIIAACDVVLYVVTDPLIESIVLEICPSARSLRYLYVEGQNRREIYDAISAQMVQAVALGQRTCGVFYGHPGVFVNPAFSAIRAVRELGRSARLFPAISAEDCLFADLEVDPGASGCQSYEATDFLLFGRSVEVGAALILWQVGAIGDPTHDSSGRDTSRQLALLRDYLRNFYPAHHRVVFYEAAIFPPEKPRIEWLNLNDISGVNCTGLTTLFVPPLVGARVPDMDMLRRLRASME